jgi:hypothetical protein
MQLGPLLAYNSGTVGPPLLQGARDDQQSECDSESVVGGGEGAVQECRST